MNRWDHLQALYNEVLEVDEPERERFLKERCRHDDRLYTEVMSLLSVEIHPLLEGLAVDVVSWPDITARAGDRIDRYRILERIGEGGMGVVYRAERADGIYEQTVALKLVKPGMDSEAVLRRFRSERQILAGLRHAGIARLLDGGLHEARPYLVVEYVDGEPITSYCDRRGLDIEDRLELFEQVCEAVAYAHQNLVVHRDLKPSNILVTEAETGRPQVKLLDFGIARLLQGSDEVLTQLGERVLTPAYAAPEQISGGRVTTATDVYGLGVVLYELLTGVRPFEGKDLLDLEHAVLEETPAPPSAAVRGTVDAPSAANGTDLDPEGSDGRSAPRRVHPAALRRRLKGDLDTIILKALRKEPERRYASAEGLLADLQRHRTKLPVTARPDRAAYRVRKFVDRHQAGVVIGLAALALVITVAALAFVRISHERDRAQLEARKAEAVAEFMQEIFAVSDPSQSRGESVTARELLDRGAERIEEELADQPEVHAQMLQVIGDVYGRLGLYDEADTLLHQALELRQSIFSGDDPEVAKTLHALGVLYEIQGKYTEAIEVDSAAIEIFRASGDDPELANSLHSLAHAQMRNGDLEDAERNIKEAVAIKKRLYGDVHPDVAYSLNILGDVYLYQDRNELGEPILREVLEMRREMLGDDHLDVGVSHHNLGAALRNLGRYAEAEEQYRLALPIWDKVYDQRGSEYGNTLSHLAFMVSRQGRLEEAVVLHREALDILRRVFGEAHPRPAVALVRLGMSYYDHGRYAESEAVYREAVATVRNVLGDGHPYASDWIARLGRTILAQGRYEEAERLFEEAHHLCSTLRAPDDACVATTRGALADLYEQWGRPDRAAAYR